MASTSSELVRPVSHHSSVAKARCKAGVSAGSSRLAIASPTHSVALRCMRNSSDTPLDAERRGAVERAEAHRVVLRDELVGLSLEVPIEAVASAVPVVRKRRGQAERSNDPLIGELECLQGLQRLGAGNAGPALHADGQPRRARRTEAVRAFESCRKRGTGRQVWVDDDGRPDHVWACTEEQGRIAPCCIGDRAGRTELPGEDGEGDAERGPNAHGRRGL